MAGSGPLPGVSVAMIRDRPSPETDRPLRCGAVGRARPRALAAVLAIAAGVAGASLPARAAGMPLPDEAQLVQQRADYEAVRPKSVVALQPFRAEQKAEDAQAGALRLISLNARMNGWFLLEITPPGGRGALAVHLENPDPEGQSVSLSAEGVPALLLEREGAVQRCRPWAGEPPPLEEARAAGLPFAPLCEGRLLLRNRVEGSRTNRERVAEFLRDNVWFGEEIVRTVRETVYKDAFLESSEPRAGDGAPAPVVPVLPDAMVARDARMAAFVNFDLAGEASARDMLMGRWYPVAGAPGIFASAIQPGEIHPDILNRRGETNALDSVERRANVYLLAYDLTQFELGYETGTDHPRLGWSPRPRRSGAAARLPGPDGINSPRPLVPLGMLSPADAGRIAATFTGGFKREHGAFRFGDYAQTNNGHHYGFIVHGVVLSKLQPDLATIYVLDDGTIGMKSWTEEDNALLPRIRFARQNGLPLIAPHPATGQPLPGSMVRHWGPGNWSGSANTELRTLRAGACLKWHMGRPFLIYAWFSSVTPSGMARTFQAYGCDYAMLLDMNALEHTYAALYTPREGGGVETRHLVEGMALVDQKERDGTPIPRFIGFPDNRDFFYLLRKEPAE